MADIAGRLAAVLDELPVAIALVSATGHFLGKAGGMAHLLGDVIPSHDPHEASRWSFTDARGVSIPRSDWPSPRALRGERVYGGLIGTYRDSSGERRMKVISMPTLDPTSEVATVVFIQSLDVKSRSAAGSHHDLQQRLIDELAKAVTTGWRDLPLAIDQRKAS